MKRHFLNFDNFFVRGWRKFDCSRSRRFAGAALAALRFGMAAALQFQFQALGWKIPYQIFLLLPYILTIIVAALYRSRAKAPAAMARSYFREG